MFVFLFLFSLCFLFFPSANHYHNPPTTHHPPLPTTTKKKSAKNNKNFLLKNHTAAWTAAPASLGRTPLPLLFGFPSQHHDRSRWPPTSGFGWIPKSLGKGPRWLAFKSPERKMENLLALQLGSNSKGAAAAATGFFRDQKPQFVLSYGVKSHHSSQWFFGISEPSTVLRSVKLTPGDEKVRRPWWSSKTSTIGCINVCFFHQPGSTKITIGFP